MQMKAKLFSRDFVFDLDEAQIGMKSTAKNKVVLPYHGELPGWIPTGKTAALCLDIVPFYPKIMLILEQEGEKTEKFKLECDEKSVLDLMAKFFNNSNETGLSTYWKGLWNAHFVDWYNWIKLSN